MRAFSWLAFSHMQESELASGSVPSIVMRTLVFFYFMANHEDALCIPAKVILSGIVVGARGEELE